jgi:hypothetical protein
MGGLDGGRRRLAERFTLLRADPYVLDAYLWLTLSDLAWAVRDAYATRQAWEETSGTPSAANANEMHRHAWKHMLDKLEAATMAAGFDMAPTSEPQSTVEALAGPGVQAEQIRLLRYAGRHRVRRHSQTKETHQ